MGENDLRAERTLRLSARQDALFIYCLRLLSHMGIVTADLSFTNLVMREINAITEDRKNAAIMPQALVTEL